MVVRAINTDAISRKIISKLCLRVFNNYVKNNVEKCGVAFITLVSMRLFTSLHIEVCGLRCS